MNEFLRTIKWKNRFGRWDMREVEADILVILAAFVVGFVVVTLVL